MIKKIAFVIMGTVVCASLLTACGESQSKAVSYKDGTYTAQSSVFVNDDGTDDGNGYGVVNLTIKDGAITECTYQTYLEDGSLKDTDYGKKDGQIANKDYYSKAQKAVAACDEYAKMLVEKGKIDDVDTISGATVNYKEFVEAVNLALDEAAQSAE